MVYSGFWFSLVFVFFSPSSKGQVKVMELQQERPEKFSPIDH